MPEPNDSATAEGVASSPNSKNIVACTSQASPSIAGTIVFTNLVF